MKKQLKNCLIFQSIIKKDQESACLLMSAHQNKHHYDEILKNGRAIPTNICKEWVGKEEREINK